MKDFLDLLQSLFLTMYCFLGSAAFLKYLLREEQSSSRPRQAKQERVRRHRTPPVLPEEPADGERICDPPAAEHPPVRRQQELHPLPERPAAPEPVRYPHNPPPGVLGQPYEVANPGYKLSKGYSLQLYPSGDGVLRAYRIGDAICVYVQPDLEDDSTNIKRLGLMQLYDMYDQNENQYRVLPAGYLRIINYQPAVCAEYGNNLTLLSKGRSVVIPVDETAYMKQGL